MHSKRIQEKVKRDYDTIAEDFSGTRQFPWKDFDLFLPYYEPDSSVLDLGCGNGRLLEFLKRHGFKKYLGVDQSAVLLKLAKKNHPKSRFLEADMSEIELKDKFDGLFAIASFHHLPPHKQLAALKNWRKMLKKGGYLFMTNWNLHQVRYWPLWIRAWVWPSYGFRGLLVPWHNIAKRYYFAFTKGRLDRLLKKAGYHVILNEYVRNGEVSNVLNGKNILTIARHETL